MKTLLVASFALMVLVQSVQMSTSHWDDHWAKKEPKKEEPTVQVFSAEPVVIKTEPTHHRVRPVVERVDVIEEVVSHSHRPVVERVKEVVHHSRRPVVERVQVVKEVVHQRHPSVERVEVVRVESGHHKKHVQNVIVEARPVQNYVVEARPIEIVKPQTVQVVATRPTFSLPTLSMPSLPSLPSLPSIPHPKDWFKRKQEPQIFVQQPVIIEKTKYVESRPRPRPTTSKPCCQGL